MSNVFRYDKRDEAELISLLRAEPEWNSFTNEESIDTFRNALLGSETYTCKSNGEVCGYLRAIVDGFGIYVSELYVAPPHRLHGHGKWLLRELKQAHPDKDVFVLSDEDPYYERLGCKRVGSVFQLQLNGRSYADSGDDQQFRRYASTFMGAEFLSEWTIVLAAVQGAE